ncbi:hypothetical protein AbraIFM66950_011781 [Aspergillus brasiliensis]|nr:hypothetical protein AbraIFM66950_011781 [Aspergillus brasiliensis]
MSTLAEATALVESIERIVNSPQVIIDLQDDSLRRRLREAGRKLSLSMEVPGDTIHRIAYAPMQVGLARVGVDTRLFEILCEEGNHRVVGHAQLASKTGVDPVLMKRLLRYYQSVGMISQPADDGFAPNNVTRALASEGGRSGICMQQDLLSLPFLAFPQFLQETAYINPTDARHTAFHLGKQTDQDLFSWLQTHPQDQSTFNAWMSAQRETHPNFLDVINFEQRFASGATATASTVLFVDIGGSKGHQSIAFKERYPSLPGRIIVQDLPHVIEAVRANPLPGFEGIETQPHDMFTPQPVKGARAYYFRNVLHDWPDDQCRRILENVKAGMTRDSVLLIDEMVLSERGSPWRAAQADLTMAVALSAMERTEAQWRALFEAVDLRVVDVLGYREELEDCVMVLALK